jgi:hypothetical protein
MADVTMLGAMQQLFHLHLQDEPLKDLALHEVMVIVQLAHVLGRLLQLRYLIGIAFYGTI